MNTRFFFIFLLLLISTLSTRAQSVCFDPQQIDPSVDCPTEGETVCGCDGQDYANACIAEFEYGITDWVSGPCATACEASFFFSHLSADTFYFYNTSNSFDSLSWTIDGSLSAVGSAASPTSWMFILPETAAEVCLTVWNSAGCSDAVCLLVYEGSPDELCNTTDCVYPGDSNGDRFANIYDLGNIGYGYGLTGPEREYFPDPSNPLFWAPNVCADWGQDINAVNFKHADCDGDGHIDEEDLQAIYANYTPDFAPQSLPTPGATPVYLEFDTTEIIINENSPDLINFSAGIYIGTDDLSVSDLHSMAFYLDYPLSLTGEQGVNVSYEENAFFGDSEELLEVKQDLGVYNTGRYDMAWSRRNNGGQTGYGRVATVNFIISSDIIMGRSAPETPFTISVDGVVLMDVNGDTLHYDLPSNSVLPIYDQTVTSQKEEALPQSSLEAFPNPAKETLYLSMPESWRAERAELFDLQGRRVLERQLNGQARAELNVAALPEGLYSVRVWSGTKQLVKRVMIVE
jgi:hypothetical protein